MTDLMRAWTWFSGQRTGWVLSVLVSTLTTLGNVALLATSGWLIARASQMPPVMELTVAVVSVRALALGRSVGRYTERLISHDATFRSLTNIRIGVYSALERATPSHTHMLRRGDALARMVADVDRLQDLPLRIVLPALSSATSAVVTISAVIFMLPTAGAVLAVGLLIVGVVNPWLGWKATRRSQAELAPAVATFTDNLLEHFDGLPDLIMLGAAESHREMLLDRDKSLRITTLRFTTFAGIASALSAAIQGLALIGCVAAAAQAQAQGQISAVMVAVIGLLPLVAFDTVAPLTAAAMLVPSVNSSTQRIQGVLTLRGNGQEQAAAFTVSRGPAVKLNEVSASWTATQSPTISDVMVDVAAGTTAALIGPSGSGKSTVLAVLNGFLPASSGTYELDGHDTTHVSGDQLRRHVVLSIQNAHIFATTVGENLRLAAPAGSQPPPDDQLVDALRIVGLEPWLHSLTDGLETVIGERGATMSGGQRQRLQIARMMIANPDVWLLDEPTEHLDRIAADALLEAIAAHSSGATVVMATHRALDVAAAATILSIENGTSVSSAQWKLDAAVESAAAARIAASAPDSPSE